MPQAHTANRPRSARALGLAAAVFFAGQAARSAVFEPAFTPDRVDFALTKQLRNGRAESPDPAAVKKALGFHSDDTNWEDGKWSLGEPRGEGETVFDYLLVLKGPVQVGSMCVNPAQEGYKGSLNNGEVWYLKPGASGRPDPADKRQWIKAELPPAQPLIRFFTFPPRTRTRAFLYRDIRVGGTSCMDYWRFYRRRLFNVTPSATGYGSGGFDAEDPGNVPRGEPWSSRRRGAKSNPPRISAKDPAWFVLAWDGPKTLDGVFLRSCANGTEFHAYRGAAGTNPGVAPESAWSRIDARAERTSTHDFKHWTFWYRWFALPSVRTSALRLRVTSVDRNGNQVWINGMGVFVDLGEERVPAVAARDEAPAFGIEYDLPVGGEASFAVDRPGGGRVRNLASQVLREPGRKTEHWDLKDDRGEYVEPGEYVFRAICAPPLELRYVVTPYPNVAQLFPDRVPWMRGHGSEHGWLSDHCQNWACATRKDRVYFGAPMAEAGVCLIECDLDGRKLWGKHDFGAWRGVNMLAADDAAVYIDRGDKVYRMEADTRQVKELFDYKGRPERRGYMSSMTAGGGKVFLAFVGMKLLDNATVPGAVDVDRCLPKPASGDDFLKALRLKGPPPGQNVNPRSAKPQGNGRLDLESTMSARRRQHIVIAFREEVPVGSVVFPHPGGAEKLRLSVLKRGAPYPPRHGSDGDWIDFESAGRKGWECVPAPANTRTRALRISFERPGDDLADDLGEEIDGLVAGGGGKGGWFRRLEGMKLLRRRFRNLSREAKVRVSSGRIDDAGAWDAGRTKPIGRDDPGVYVMEWSRPRKIAGLAVKEIDGAVTEVDCWQGPAPGRFPLGGDALDKKSKATGWRTVATYRQKRRSAYHPSSNRNTFARYLDGYVDFEEPVETPAVRLRVVEQWLDNGEKNAECRRHDGRSEHGMHYTQSYAAKLDTRPCRIEGVAALEYLGGELAVEPMVYERLEVYDGRTGKLEKELPVKLGWHSLSFGPDGELYAIEKDHETISRVDLRTGRVTPVVRGSEPSTMSVGPDGSFYVFPWTDNGRAPIRVYDRRGRFVRNIGKPGGLRPGRWDPERFGKVHRLRADAKGSLWVLETQNYPRRILQFRTSDGALVKEILGNTTYGGGGGGTVNRYDPTRAYYGRVEFEIDPERHTSRVRGLLADSLHGNDLVAVRVKGQRRTYLATAPLSMHPRQSHGVVYIYDDAAGTVRMAAAMGDAAHFGPLRTSSAIARLKGDVPKYYTFHWADMNGDGAVGGDEVSFEKKPDPRAGAGVGRFDEELGCTGPGVRYRVARFLAGGTPVYERSKVHGAPHFRFDDGSYLTLCGRHEKDGPTENFATNPEGKKLWGYPVGGGGVSGLHIPSWQPGLVSNEFAVIGHETARRGQLGEFVVVHANTGQWKIWTADGLIAGQVLLHKTDSRSRFFSSHEKAEPGMRLDPLTASQEHFHGFFTGSEDGRYFIAAGFTHMSIVEVKGIDRFRRAEVKVRVTPEDIRRAEAWRAERTRRSVAGRALLVEAVDMERPPEIDGRRAAHEWPRAACAIGGDADAAFSVGFDDKRLYLCWTGKGLGPVTNTGTDFRRYFKTGACLDFMIGADPGADPGRRRPARGDQRLLVTFVDGRPKVVLYQPVSPGARAGERWRTFTEAGGETAFDRVVLLADASAALREEGDRFTVEADVPLSALGLGAAGGTTLKMDWGVLTTADGTQVKQRMYWSNRTATGTSDEAVEARLEPHMWGHVRFPGPD